MYPVADIMSPVFTLVAKVQAVMPVVNGSIHGHSLPNTEAFYVLTHFADGPAHFMTHNLGEL